MSRIGNALATIEAWEDRVTDGGRRWFSFVFLTRPKDVKITTLDVAKASLVWGPAIALADVLLTSPAMYLVSISGLSGGSYGVMNALGIWLLFTPPATFLFFLWSRLDAIRWNRRAHRLQKA